MPADMYTVNKTKELIIAFLNARGPSLPVHIARDVKTSPLFAAAFLSELYNEGKIKMTNMKIGSSSLYYLPGQEDQIENFITYLNVREKEAFNILKSKKALEDEKLEPVVRVALRAIRDFAVPFHSKDSPNPKILWRYHMFPEEEAHILLSPVPAQQIQVQQITPTTQQIPLQSAIESPQSALQVESVPPILKEKPKRQNKPKQPLKKVEISLPFDSLKEEPKEEESQFVKDVRSFLEKKEIEILEITDKKKEVTAKVRLKTLLGHQNFFLIAKDKKRIKEEELIDALQKAHAQKMPALLVAPGELEKKAHILLQEWNSLIKFEKIK